MALATTGSACLAMGPETVERPEAGQTEPTWVWSEAAGLEFTRTEITVAQFRACAEAGACRRQQFETTEDTDLCNYGQADRDDHPMNCVSWYAATNYCAWTGGRIPSFLEWSAEATRRGQQRFPWGDEAPSCDLANFAARSVDGKDLRGCGRDHTWAVGSAPRGASPAGLLDMVGNVEEWVDRPDPVFDSATYPERSDVPDWMGSQPNPATGPPRAMAGFGWRSPVEYLEHSRYTVQAGAMSGTSFLVGFRCVRE